MNNLSFALFWCSVWGEGEQPQNESIVSEIRKQITQGIEINLIVESVSQLEEFAKFQETLTKIKQLEQLENFPETLEQLVKLTEQLSNTWDKKIGLVYGGATKIKQYVFESAKLPEIRGASAILDRINLIDLPAFLGQKENYQKTKKLARYKSTEKWLNNNFPGLQEALIPQLIIYSTGGNILAFCPAYFVDDLASAIEKRYTEETLTANSCAVGATFKLLETRLGLLPDKITEKTNWFDNWYLSNKDKDLVTAYFGKPKEGETDAELFQNRKSFNELAGKLATLFNQRRSGNDTLNRPSRRYPPIFETHPYLQRDNNDFSSAITEVQLPNNPQLSDSLARKRIAGQRTKGEDSRGQKWWSRNPVWKWQDERGHRLLWRTGIVKSWVFKYKRFLTDLKKTSSSNYCLSDKYYDGITVNPRYITEARSLKEIGNASNGYVGYIYADGNNMGGYIQKIKTPQEYQNFSRDIFTATEKSVYLALAEHLQPHQLKNINDSENKNREGKWIHPFEIITIGGDDVMLIVPANQALQVAQTLSEQFEKILLKNSPIPNTEIIEDYCCQQIQTQEQIEQTHRYNIKENIAQTQYKSQCKLSMSAGVLITAMNTPVYYAEKLTNQLLKSAKKKAKQLKKEFAYYGGTVDFLVLKAVTMISSDIEAFREQGLIKQPSGKTKLKLYSTPYTLQEINAFINTVKAFKEVDFPKSQLYQIRSLLERGKRTAIINYRYFKVRLKQNKELLTNNFETAWCKPKDKNNKGNLAPWMSLKQDGETIYETIWREIVDIYPFMEKPKTDKSQQSDSENKQEVNQ